MNDIQLVVNEFCVQEADNAKEGEGEFWDIKEKVGKDIRRFIEFLEKMGFEIDNKFVDHSAWVIIERTRMEYGEDGIRWKAFPCIQEKPKSTVDVVVDKGQRYIIAKEIISQTKG